jgi:hypothetical protein
MLRYGRFRVLLDTVPEGVLVTIHDDVGFVCEVVGLEVQAAVLAALAAAQSCDDEPMTQSSDDELEATLH